MVMTRKREKNIATLLRTLTLKLSVSEFEVSSSLAKAFSRLSSPYENSKSTSGYPCKLKQIFVDFLRGLNLGKFLPGC